MLFAAHFSLGKSFLYAAGVYALSFLVAFSTIYAGYVHVPLEYFYERGIDWTSTFLKAAIFFVISLPLGIMFLYLQ